MTFDLVEHRHRVAAWAAARATTRGVRGLSARQALDWTARLGLRELLRGPERIPEASDFDARHRQWRDMLIDLARESGKVLAHGGAAKLINVYLKLGIVCAYCDADGEVSNALRGRVGAFHPPIDGLLLGELVKQDPKTALAQRFRTLNVWSQLSSDQYEEIIAGIRTLLPTNPTEFWRIEEYWPVTRDNKESQRSVDIVKSGDGAKI